MYGEFGAMLFPRQHLLAQHLIHDDSGSREPFGMDDQDTSSTCTEGRPRSEFNADSFDRPAAAGGRGKTPGEIQGCDGAAHRARGAAGGWDGSSSSTTAHSLLGYPPRRGVSEQALRLRPVFNMEGRFHFSLVECFTPGTTTCSGTWSTSTPRGHPGRSLHSPPPDETRLGAEVHAIEQRADDVVVHFTGQRRDAELRHRGRVHPSRAGRAPPAHGDHRARHREVVFDPDVYYGRAHKIFMQFSRRGGGRLPDHPRLTVTDLAIRNVVYTPAGQDPSIAKGVIIARTPGSRIRAYSMLDEPQRISQASRTSRRSIPRRRTPSSSASHTTGRWTNTPAASVPSSVRTR